MPAQRIWRENLQNVRFCLFLYFTFLYIIYSRFEYKKYVRRAVLLYIGKDTLVPKKDIIMILDYKEALNNDDTNKFLNIRLNTKNLTRVY